jgi:hypothetical protein
MTACLSVLILISKGESSEMTASVVTLVRRGESSEMTASVVTLVSREESSETTAMEVFMRFQRRVRVWLICEINATKSNPSFEP